MKTKHSLFLVIISCAFFLFNTPGARYSHAEDNPSAEDHSLNISQSVPQTIQGTAIKGGSADLTNEPPGKSITHGVSVIDTGSKPKKSFELSHKTPSTAWRKRSIIGAQSLNPKAAIKQPKELQDMEVKRKSRKESRKKSLESRPARKILKPGTDEKDNAP